MHSRPSGVGGRPPRNEAAPPAPRSDDGEAGPSCPGMQQGAVAAGKGCERAFRQYAPRSTSTAALVSWGVGLWFLAVVVLHAVCLFGTESPASSAFREAERAVIAQTEKKLVVIAGMERTGSTWQFLAVRQIFRSHGHAVKDVHSHSLQQIFDLDGCVSKGFTCIAKIHEFEPALLIYADRVLISHRDARDILISVSQTFESCLDYSRRTCEGNSAIGLLPHEPPLDVTTHLQHYSKWRGVADYDMEYERMMQDPVAEIMRLAYVVGFEIDRAFAQHVNDEVNALAAARTRNKATWDKSTGLAREHVHASNKSAAHTDSALVAGLTWPNGPCHLVSEFQQVERRYGQWMTEAGYLGARPAPEPTLRVLNDSVRAAAAARLEMLNAHTQIVHVVNYFVGDTSAARTGEQGLHDWEIRLTQESVRRALTRAAAAASVDVTFVAAVFPGDEAALGALEGLARTCYLTRRKSAYLGSPGRPIPYIQDIMQCALKAAADNGNSLDNVSVVYTNADIAVQSDFYLEVGKLTGATRGTATSFSVTRRELVANNPHDYPALVASGRVDEAIEAAYAAPGKDHAGHDTFVMPAHVLASIDLGAVTIAFSPWGCTLSALLHARGGFRVLPKLRWTFHFGTLRLLPDVPPGNWVTCDNVTANTKRLLASRHFNTKDNTHCGSPSAVGVCCASCGPLLESVSAEQRRTVLGGDGVASCDWHKSYGLSRSLQSSAHWRETVSNTLASLDALKDNAPEVVRRCCALASRGAKPFTLLKRRWSNPKNDVSATCCVVASGGVFRKQPPRELLNAWCRTNVEDDDRVYAVPSDPMLRFREALRQAAKKGRRVNMSLVPDQSDEAALYPALSDPLQRREGGANVASSLARGLGGATPSHASRVPDVGGKTVLLFHESAPSTLEGGDFRSYQLALWLCERGASVTVVTRSLDPGLADPSCGLHEKVTETPDTEYSRTMEAYRHERHVYALAVLAAIGATVVEDDVCLSRTRRALLEGGDDVIPPLRAVNNIFATLWFYRQDRDTLLSLPSVPSTLLSILDERGAGVKRPVFAVLSDDIHHERARTIATVRGDEGQRAANIEVAELSVYRNEGIDFLFAVTNADQASYVSYRDSGASGGGGGGGMQKGEVGAGGEARKPVIRTLPFVSSATLPKPFNCSQAWWAEDGKIAPTNPFQKRSIMLYIGSGHYSNVIAVTWLLRKVLPMWAFIAEFMRTNHRMPTLDEIPPGFAESQITSKAQLSVPPVQLVGTTKWRSLKNEALASNKKLSALYSRVIVSNDGFVPDLDAAFSKARVLLAPNFVYGSGISTKVMQGLEHGVPVAVNSGGGNGYDCDDVWDGRLRCAHMQLCGAPTRDARDANNRTVDAYWYARSVIGLWGNKERWNEIVRNGKTYVAHTRSLASWDDVLRPLFRGS